MKPFRLEELLRLLAIALSATLVGLAVLFLQSFGEAAEADAPTIAVISFLTALTFLFVATPITVVAGLVLHLLARLVPIPRLLLLPVFVGVGYIAIRLVFPEWNLVHAPIVLGITVPAWAMYSFGPLRLWKYEFDPDLHSDF